MRKTAHAWQAALMVIVILFSCLSTTAAAKTAGVEDHVISGSENFDLLLCNGCGETEFFWIYDIPEYALGGSSLTESGVVYADGSWEDYFLIDGTRVDIIPGIGDNAYTGHHWRMTMCLNCGALNGDLPAVSYGFWNKMYRLEECPAEHLWDETRCEPTDGAHHLVTGVDTSVCHWCGGSRSEQASFLEEHDWANEVTEPTCTQGGYTIFTCHRCGDSYQGNETEAVGHQFGDWCIGKEPTLDEEGLRSRVCKVCGEMEIETLPRLDPKPTSNPKPDPVRHNAYIGGLRGGIFDPSRPMTRAETAVILTRLLTGEMPPLEEQAYDDTIITRAEFTAVVVGLFGTPEGERMVETPFSDIPVDHWAIGAIQRATALGWLQGNEAGLSRLDTPITRAEAVVMLNRVLNRQPDRAYIDAHATELRTFTDVGANHWAWYDILEATNGHDAFPGQQEAWRE